MAGQLQWALALAARGLRVFPCREYGKKPAIERFQIDATTDPNIIRGWWTDRATGREYEYNIGILTNDIVVSDVDAKKGPHALENFHALGGHFDTFTVKTASQGYHAYYDGPNSRLAVNITPGVDIRSHGGYVIGPGSYVDPAISREPDITVAGWYELVADKPMAWVPSGIETLLKPPGRNVRIEGDVERDKPTSIANAAVWLMNAPPAVEGMGGDNTTYQIAAALCRDYALTEETAFALLCQYWNERCSPPWEHDELWRKVQNANDYGTGILGGALPEVSFADVQVVPQPVGGIPENTFHFGNLWEPKEIRPRPWLASRLLMRGDVTVTAATGATGKSILTLVILAHFAVGKDFGPYKLSKPGVPLRSIVYNAEDRIEEQSRRVEAICAQYRLPFHDVKRNLCIMDDSHGYVTLVTAPDWKPETNMGVVQYFVELAKNNDAAVLSFDPLVNMHTVNEGDNGHMRHVMGVFRSVAAQANAAVWLNHHTSKSAAKDDRGVLDVDAVRGAGGIVNASRITKMLSPATQNDRDEYGLATDDKHSYMRIDDVKSNMYLRSTRADVWFKWEPQQILSGDVVGVPIIHDMGGEAVRAKVDMARTLRDFMIVMNRATMSRADAVRVLRNDDGLYAVMTDQAVRRRIEVNLARPVRVDKDVLTLVRNGHEADITLT